MKKEFRLILFTVVFFSLKTNAQVNSVEFGKNRVQYQKFNWKFYQTENFNTYFSQDGLALGKYVAQVAEEQLSSIEEFVEYGLQRRANIVVYNNFDEFQQSNIGLGIDWQNTGGVTKLVNNKIILYFDGNHENLKRQIRQGIAKVLVDNVLFGDDLGEFAANQALLDLLNRFAERKNATPAQIALAWVLAQKPWIVPIPGTTKLHRLQENIEASKIEFTKEELQEMETASAQIKILGERYPEALEKTTGL